MFKAPDGAEKLPKNRPLVPMQARWSHETLAEIPPHSPLPLTVKEERTAPSLTKAMVKRDLKGPRELLRLNVLTNLNWRNLKSSSSCPRREGLQPLSSEAGYGIPPFPMTWLRPRCQAAPSCLQVEGREEAGESRPEGERDFSLSAAASFP